MPVVESRYAVHHIGADGAGLGGIFDIDSNTVRQGWRFTCHHEFRPEAIWIYCSTENLGTQGVRVRFNEGLALDRYQPDTTTPSVRWIPPANAAAGWQRFELEASGTSLKDTHQAGKVCHVTFERQSGTFTGTNRLRMYTVRSRFPQHYSHQITRRGRPIYDPYNAFMRTPALADPAQPYTMSRDNNASFHPLFWIECDDGTGFGNPYDLHVEDTIYGAKTAVQYMTMPRDLTATFVSMFVRGAGVASDPDLDPDGPCMLNVTDTVSGQEVYSGSLVLTDDRLFVSRSHWFGRWTDPGMNLIRGREYKFELSAPACDLSDPTDGYLISYDATTLALATVGDPHRLPTRMVLNGVSIEGQADMGIILRDNATQTSLAVIDELLAPAAGAWPTYATAASAYQINVLVRNMGIDSSAGGDLWSRIVDAETGATLSAIQTHAAIDANDENAVTHSFTMPAADVHMLIQCGHYEGATPVQDDEALNEVRLI